MTPEDHQRKPDPELRELYPELTDAELIVAEDKLAEYPEFALRLCRGILTDPERYRWLRILTARENDLTIDRERSNGYNNSTNS
jgi:hypothetical protein